MRVDISKIQWKSHILIIDYNTFHYTSFDVFRAILLNRDFAKSLLPEYKAFFRMDYMQQVKFFFENQMERDLYHLFSKFPQKKFPYDIYDLLDVYYGFDGSVTTNTDLNTYMGAALGSKTIGDISILRHPDDKSELYVPDDCKIFRTKGLFNTDSIVSFIEHHRVDAVILDSVDLAIDISENTENTTFIFGSYQYNYFFDQKNRLRFLKRMDDMNRLEYNKHHQYGKFDPIRALHTISTNGGNKS